MDGAFGGGQPSLPRSTYFPLTPSPTSPFRAHRHPSANTKPPRPKPYHRPTGQASDLKLQHPNLTQCGTIVGTASPFSPITPTSLSSASSSTVTTPSTLSYHGCSAVNTNTLSIPVFASTAERAQARSNSSPVVFTADYLEARLASFGGNIGGPPPQPQAQQQQPKAQCVSTGLGYQDQPDILSLIKDFPYASAYVDVSSVPQAQAPSRSQDSGVMAQAAPAVHTRDEEIRKQRYAVDLIETAIKTLHKIWPETQEPEREAAPGPVTSEGKLRASFVTQFPNTAVHTTAQDKAAARLRRRPSVQQFTPESSPDSGKKKRKRGEASTGSEGVRDGGDEKVCKRSCVGETKIAYPTCPRVLTPPVEHKPEPVKAAPPQSHHISLKIFVRELLRRSKTSCNTLEVALCYLDGVEETVKKLRDCLKLGIAFGTVAMAERGPYDEGMKDEGRIITAVEWMRQEAMKQEDDGMDVRGDWPHHQHGQEWAPLSPPGSDASSDKASKATTPAAPTQVLATHPLLDARRTFLASLVLATKFIQDKAYSNKAWAKLSGLAGKEVGRCERALGGALQWRLWVGKECGATSSIRGRSPLGNEEVESLCSGDSETVVHGENDPIAKALMEEAMKKQKSTTKWGSDTELSTPTAVAPAEFVARLALTSSRATGSGRARTWHAPEKVEEEIGALEAFVGPTLQSSLRSSANSAASSCSTLLDQPSTFNLTSAAPISHASQTTFVDSQYANAFGMPFSHSPLSLEGEQLLNALLKGGEDCEAPATVKMNVDDSASGKKTPTMSMATSFANNEPLPLAGFLDSWQPQSTFPFTFTALPPSKLQPLHQLPRLSIPKQQVQQRSQSLGSLLPLPRLLHPQTAALRASGGSGSSTSPHSSSTFSSPEVLTPVHSRAGTLVDVGEYYQDWMGRGKEFQQCVDQLYCGNNGNQFGVGIQAPALQS
ncbi:hypothetical protein M407DRAFT_3963 [Tulasnella calospora MUT 4182]|uniref:Uncharacterized protein n=1 Tax=Tulasnella calospora MUT 4182 TaxID=1051891 RepID=A0A0C3QWU7_9AGAM|nr:hypothetical protein M407DRAFT_3963 [Tulasnella calospora MUT 4182]